MCCGQDEGPLVAAVGEPMSVKVYTATEGAVIQIGTYGMASNDAPALVPESVAAELEGRPDLVIVREPALAQAVAAAADGADFVIPEDNHSPASPAKRARKAQE